MKGTLDRLPTVVLGKFPAMIDQDPKSFKSSLVVAPILPSSSIPFSSINSYGPSTSQMPPQQVQSNIVFTHQGANFMENQPYHPS